MKVLVGIITRNRASLLPKAIRSALEQDYPNKEVVVLDIASTDDTPKLRDHFPQVKWIRSEARLGIPESRNLLMENTDAEFFFSLDDDAWFLQRDEIGIGIELMQTARNVAVAAYDIILPGDQAKIVRTAPHPTHLFIGCGHLLRLSAIRAVGYYARNPAVYGGSEETDLCLRLMAAGHEIMFLPGAHVWHERSDVGRDIFDQHRSNVCNDLVCATRRCPMPLLIAVLPGKVLNHFRFSIAKRRFSSFAAGIWLFIRALPDVLRTRDPISQKVFREFLRRSRTASP